MMTIHDHRLTHHAETRMRQRGLRDDDLNLLLAVASQIAPDAYLLTEKDAAREIAARKMEIARLERLRGSKVVVEGGSVITFYRPGREGLKRALRRR